VVEKIGQNQNDLHIANRSFTDFLMSGLVMANAAEAAPLRMIKVSINENAFGELWWYSALYCAIICGTY